MAAPLLWKIGPCVAVCECVCVLAGIEYLTSDCTHCVVWRAMMQTHCSVTSTNVPPFSSSSFNLCTDTQPGPTHHNQIKIFFICTWYTGTLNFDFSFINLLLNCHHCRFFSPCCFFLYLPHLFLVVSIQNIHIISAKSFKKKSFKYSKTSTISCYFGPLLYTGCTDALLLTCWLVDCDWLV